METPGASNPSASPLEHPTPGAPPARWSSTPTLSVGEAEGSSADSPRLLRLQSHVTFQQPVGLQQLLHLQEVLPGFGRCQLRLRKTQVSPAGSKQVVGTQHRCQLCHRLSDACTRGWMHLLGVAFITSQHNVLTVATSSLSSTQTPHNDFLPPQEVPLTPCLVGPKHPTHGGISPR